MKLVLDTNVLISGLLNPQGTPGTILFQLKQSDWKVLWDERIFSEYQGVLGRSKFNFTPSRIHDLLQAIQGHGVRIFPQGLDLTLPDPDDLPFLEVAVAGGADFLITGNLKDFPVESRYGIRVVAPAEFYHAQSLTLPAQPIKR